MVCWLFTAFLESAINIEVGGAAVAARSAKIHAKMM